jgi:3-deoxy-D-arabino-heptulosonate 7-phosphate (DAHP) synthase
VEKTGYYRGPCTVESLDQMETVASHLAAAPVQALRGGVYKPRTSPYAFQGMGVEGLRFGFGAIALLDPRRHRSDVNWANRSCCG